ncbi:phage replisome organizer N-terminal domain-containing protein [uncultured Fusobacterium sp.]|uniref:phage replisome organizer N-terminal domain-containing protein n=1 Tax=uncultured Fusobacterium sp. TaxID=159267 RepID=UPI0025F82B71|nr:phage replisome organizer N-terminal domain-containing protein [uncultured Fusobacterium sp.]
MAKKYVWLKLKEDFFQQKAIKKLRRMTSGGAVYTLIYLKIQLLSLKNEGKLYFEGVEDNFIDEIALEIDESAEDVQMTVMYLQKNGLLEIGDLPDEYILPEVLGSIGSETAAAERKRQQRLREKEKKLIGCDNVTPLSLGVTKSHTEEEKEEDKEEDKEEEERKKKLHRLSSKKFEEKIRLLKEIILRATLCNEHQLALVFRPVQYKGYIDDLLLNIEESDYLQGKVSGKMPNLQTFTVEAQINRILAGFYKTHSSSKIKELGINDLKHSENDADILEML